MCKIGFIGPAASSPKALILRILSEYIEQYKVFDVVGELYWNDFSLALFAAAKEKKLNTIGFTTQLYGMFELVNEPVLVSSQEYDSMLITFCDIIVFFRNSDFVDSRIDLAKQENKEIREIYALS